MSRLLSSTSFTSISSVTDALMSDSPGLSTKSISGRKRNVQDIQISYDDDDPLGPIIDTISPEFMKGKEDRAKRRLALQLSGFAEDYKTVDDLRRAQKQWDNSDTPETIIREFKRICGIRESKDVETKKTEEDFSSSVVTTCIEEWKGMVIADIEKQKRTRKSHPSKYVDDEAILKVQKEVYACLGNKKVPHDPEDVKTCNMLFAEKYKRVDVIEPVFSKVMSKKENNKVTVVIDADNLSVVFREPSLPAKNPVKVLIQQKGAGKSFEIYNLSRTNYVFFFNMSTLKNSERDNTTIVRPSGTGKSCVSRYYNAVIDIVGRVLSDEDRFNLTVRLTIKMMYAAIFHLYAWKQVFPGAEHGCREWFKYSLTGGRTLGEIFSRLEEYETIGIGKVINSLKWPKGLDIENFVLCFDEAGELTTSKPIDAKPFRARGTNIPLKIGDKGSSIFHPFCEALILMGDLGMHRLLCGTTLSLSHVSLGKSSALKVDEVSILLLKDLGNTSLKEIKEQIIGYFPCLKDTLDAENFDKQLEKFVGRSRYLYDVLLGKLFNMSKKLGESGSPEKFEDLFKEKLESFLESSIQLYRSYIESYVDSNILNGISDVKTAEAILDDVLHDIVLGTIEPKSISFDICAALLDHGLMRCMTIGEDNIIELSQMEYVASMAIVSYYSRPQGPEVITAGSKKQKIEFDVTTDPILANTLISLRQNPPSSGLTFEKFMMRYFQLDLYGRKNILKAKYMEEFKQPNLAFYSMHVFLFMAETSDGKQPLNFVKYLEHIENYTTVGYFPPNNAGPDGILPIVRRPFKELEEEFNMEENDYKKLPKIRLICLQFKFYRSGTLSGKKGEHAIDTTDLDELYNSDRSDPHPNVEVCRNIFKNGDHPLFQASKHALRSVIMSGNISEVLAENVKKKAILFRVDREEWMPFKFRSIFGSLCNEFEKILYEQTVDWAPAHILKAESLINTNLPEACKICEAASDEVILKSVTVAHLKAIINVMSAREKIYGRGRIVPVSLKPNIIRQILEYFNDPSNRKSIVRKDVHEKFHHLIPIPAQVGIPVSVTRVPTTSPVLLKNFAN